MTSQRSSPLNLEETLCEEPHAFKFFSASDGRVARAAANRRGLVAVYAGRDRYSLYSDIRGYRFLAVPAEFAEILVRGKLILPRTREEREVILTLADRRLLTIHDGRRRRYQLTDRNTIRDIRRQLRRIKGQAGGRLFEALPRHISRSERGNTEAGIAAKPEAGIPLRVA